MSHKRGEFAPEIPPGLYYFLAITIVFVVFMGLIVMQARQIDGLTARVQCLERPWVASSTSARITTGVIQVSKPTRTECKSK